MRGGGTTGFWLVVPLTTNPEGQSMIQPPWRADSYRIRDREVRGHVFLTWSHVAESARVWAAQVSFRADKVTDLGEFPNELAAMEAVQTAITTYRER